MFKVCCYRLIDSKRAVSAPILIGDNFVKQCTKCVDVSWDIWRLPIAELWAEIDRVAKVMVMWGSRKIGNKDLVVRANKNTRGI